MIHTGDSLLELVVITFETDMFFGRGFLLEDAVAVFSASSSSSSQPRFVRAKVIAPIPFSLNNPKYQHCSP